MIRSPLIESDGEELLQRERSGQSPGDTALAVKSSEETYQKQLWGLKLGMQLTEIQTRLRLR